MNTNTKLTVAPDERHRLRILGSDVLIQLERMQGQGEDNPAPKYAGVYTEGWAETAPDGKTITLCVTMPVPVAIVVNRLLGVLRGSAMPSLFGTLLHTELHALRTAEDEAGNGPYSTAADPRTTHPLNYLAHKVGSCVLGDSSVGRRRWERLSYLMYPFNLSTRLFDKPRDNP